MHSKCVHVTPVQERWPGVHRLLLAGHSKFVLASTNTCRFQVPSHFREFSKNGWGGFVVGALCRNQSKSANTGTSLSSKKREDQADVPPEGGPSV